MGVYVAIAEVKGPPNQTFREIRTRAGKELSKVGKSLSLSNCWTSRPGGGGGLARHGTSIRWARLIARMFGHGHRAMCSGGCQFEVLEESVLAQYVPAHKTDEADTEIVGAGERRRSVGERRRASKSVGECAYSKPGECWRGSSV